MIAAIILFVCLAGLYGMSYALNAKTPVPEGCEEARKECTGCQIMNCPNRKG